MKKPYLSLFAGLILICQSGRAQTNLTQAVDFTVTDVNGIVHNLFNILSNGQHVCIDFFFDTCGPCQVTSPYFKQTYNNFGCNNEDIFFIAIDVGDTDAQVIAYENTFLGGAPGYPSVSGNDGGGNAVVSAYGIGAYPTYILIQPDHTIIEQDMWPITDASTFTSYLTSHGLNPVSCTVGIEEALINAKGVVFPNPATETITISSSEKYSGYTIWNTLGEIVIKGTIKNINQTVNIAALPDGVYYIEMASDQNTIKSRFVKQ